jgi:tRNA modification GTPase
VTGGVEKRETIFALSSGAAPSAIAIVRISGPDAAATLRAVAGRLPPPRRASTARLRSREGATLDHALILWFPGPRTATGEDLAELHLHGGRAVIAAVLRDLSERPGLRPAEPGEYSRRGFLNDRLTLDEAEGLGELLAADTEVQRRHALRRAEGGLGRLVARWRGELLALSAQVEAAMQFGEEEEDVPALRLDDTRRLEAIGAEIDAALQQIPAERLRDGVRVVFAGPPNTGKSSLFNALVGREAAIVSPFAGTTRDIIEAAIDLDGMPLVMLDSAGQRETSDPIEEIGVHRAKAATLDADIVLWLGTAETAPCGSIVIESAADMRHGHDPHPRCDVRTSTVDGAGLAQLRDIIVARARSLLPGEDELVFNLRQRAALATASAALCAARNAPEPLILAEELRTARASLDRLTGAGGVEDLLDRIFASFCIGK